MSNSMTDLQGLREAAAALAGELQQLRGRFQVLDLAHGCDWVARELDGYPAPAAVPRYRNVPCETWAELVAPDGAIELAALPTAHLAQGDLALVREGILRLEDIGGAGGFRPEAGAFVRTIAPQKHALYLRGMPAERAGWRILKAWEAMPLAGLHAMVRAIGEYGRAMHQDALRRSAASGPPTSRTGGSRAPRR